MYIDLVLLGIQLKIMQSGDNGTEIVGVEFGHDHEQSTTEEIAKNKFETDEHKNDTEIEEKDKTNISESNRNDKVHDSRTDRNGTSEKEPEIPVYDGITTTSIADTFNRDYKAITRHKTDTEIYRPKKIYRTEINKPIPKEGKDAVNNGEKQMTAKPAALPNLEPITAHIRMEEIQWQRLMERKLHREVHEKQLEQRYRDEIKTHICNIEKQKRNDGLVLKRRMVEFEKKRRSHNNAFCRMLQRKDKEYQVENEALFQRILEIDKQKQKNVTKLKTRVNYLEDRKQREQEVFLQRMQELEHRREEEYEASQKRFQEIEKRKYNERKAWLLQVQKIEGMKKEVFKRSMKALPETKELASALSQYEDKNHVTKVNSHNNMKDQVRVMESVKNVNTRGMLLPKIHHRRGVYGKQHIKTGRTKNKVKSGDCENEIVGEKMYVNDGARNEDNKTDDFRLGVPVSN